MEGQIKVYFDSVIFFYALDSSLTMIPSPKDDDSEELKA